jgi:hypothetical protein
MTEWDNLLCLAEFTYNSSTYKAIHVSSFKADNGYVLRVHLEFLVDPRGTEQDGLCEVSGFAKEVQSHLREIRECLEVAQDAMVA